MDFQDINMARAQRYHFFSAMFRDEIPKEIVEKMGSGAFFSGLLDLQNITSLWEKVRAKARVPWDIGEGVLAVAGGYGGKFGLEGDPKYPQFTGFNTNILLPSNVACKFPVVLGAG